MVTVYGLQTLEKNTPFVYGNNNALMEISSAHNFGACTNVSCLNKLESPSSAKDALCQVWLKIA